MKKFKIESRGILPEYVAKYILPYDGEEINQDSMDALDEDIRFLTCDIVECAGNTDRDWQDGPRAAWCCPLKSGNEWNLVVKAVWEKTSELCTSPA
jgi:hypothetical protein